MGVRGREREIPRANRPFPHANCSFGHERVKGAGKRGAGKTSAAGGSRADAILSRLPREPGRGDLAAVPGGIWSSPAASVEHRACFGGGKPRRLPRGRGEASGGGQGGVRGQRSGGGMRRRWRGGAVVGPCRAGKCFGQAVECLGWIGARKPPGARRRIGRSHAAGGSPDDPAGMTNKWPNARAPTTQPRGLCPVGASGVAFLPIRH
jgi:hypothetical protein